MATTRAGARAETKAKIIATSTKDKNNHSSSKSNDEDNGDNVDNNSHEVLGLFYPNASNVQGAFEGWEAIDQQP